MFIFKFYLDPCPHVAHFPHQNELIANPWLEPVLKVSSETLNNVEKCRFTLVHSWVLLFTLVYSFVLLWTLVYSCVTPCNEIEGPLNVISSEYQFIEGYIRFTLVLLRDDFGIFNCVFLLN